MKRENSIVTDSKYQQEIDTTLNMLQQDNKWNRLKLSN